MTSWLHLALLGPESQWSWQTPSLLAAAKFVQCSHVLIQWIGGRSKALEHQGTTLRFCVFHWMMSCFWGMWVIWGLRLFHLLFIFQGSTGNQGWEVHPYFQSKKWNEELFISNFSTVLILRMPTFNSKQLTKSNPLCGASWSYSSSSSASLEGLLA